jgi:hypothetical protein
MSKVNKPVVMKGKLKFKGSGGSKSGGAKRSAPSVSLHSPDPAPAAGAGEGNDSAADGSEPADPPSELDGLLTESQKKHMKRRQELDDKALKTGSSVSYRERIEAFNTKLSTLTEHNDIPRISAAGNG